MNSNPKQQDQQDVDVLIGQPATVVLYNDEIHTFDEVINQIMKATGCNQSKAEAMTMEVHTTGKAAVYEGAMPECLRVSSTLEEIALHTQIEV